MSENNHQLAIETRTGNLGDLVEDPRVEDEVLRQTLRRFYIVHA